MEGGDGGGRGKAKQRRKEFVEGGVKGKGDKRCDRERNTDIYITIMYFYMYISFSDKR